MNNKEKLKKIDKELSELKNKQYLIKKIYLEELYDKCQENIGRCFKDTDGYFYKIISTEDIKHTMTDIFFNEYSYDSISFKYPYDESLKPFKDKAVNIAFLKNNNIKLLKSFIEISNEEYDKKFKEVNNLWVNKVQNL